MGVSRVKEGEMLLIVLRLLLLLGEGLVESETVDYDCEFQQYYKDLVCYCARYRLPLTTLSSLVKPYSEAVSVKIQACQSIELILDPPSHMNQLRIEHVDNVKLHNITITSGGFLEVVAREIKEEVIITGDLTKKSENKSHIKNTDLNDKDDTISDFEGEDSRLHIQVHDAKRVIMNKVSQGPGVHFSWVTQDIGSLEVTNSRLILMKGGWEVSRVPEVWFTDSLFLSDWVEGGLVLSEVNRTSVRRCVGLSMSSLLLLSSSTQVSFSCSIPQSWDQEECGPVAGLLGEARLDEQEEEIFGKPNPILLAVLCMVGALGGTGFILWLCCGRNK